MAGTIVVDRIESDASYASTINVANRITFSNTVNFGVTNGTAPVAGFYLPSTNNLVFTTASTERLRIDSNGIMLSGLTSPLTVSGASTWQQQIAGTGATGSVVARFSDNANPPRFFTVKSRGASVGTNTIVQNGDELGSLDFVAADGTSYSTSARISANIDGTPGTGDLPTRLTFNLASDGSATLTERMRIDSSGNLLFNSGFGSVATAYGCRAWVNFNGTGTVAIRSSGNVSSITDTGTGAYTVNLSTAMPDTNYACAMATRASSGAGTPMVAVEHASLAARTTTSTSLHVVALNGATPDADIVEVMFFR